MVKVTLALGVVLALFVVDSSCQKFIQPTFRPLVPNNRPRLILPTFRPPPRKPILRLARELGEFKPPKEGDVTVAPLVYEHLNRSARSLDSPSAKREGGSHSTSSGSRNIGPTHPGYNRRNARSVDSPSAKRGGGSPRTSSGSKNTGPTHPGYNRRNAREVRPGHFNPLRPKPIFPRPPSPVPVPRIPILARTVRDIQIPGVKKPTHRDVIIPNWNPNVRTNPWERIGRRHGRSLDSPSAKRAGGSPRTSSDSTNTGPTHPGYNRRNARDIRLPGHLNPLRPKPLYPRPMVPAPVPRIPILARTARDIQIPGVKKPTHRDVIIPNWNPNARTNPWNRVGGRHRRRLEDVEAELGMGSHERETRDIQVSGLPELKKPTYRDVVIPNWNPHVRTNPWDSLGGRHY